MNLYLKFFMDVPFIKCINVVLLEMKLYYILNFRLKEDIDRMCRIKISFPRKSKLK